MHHRKSPSETSSGSPPSVAIRRRTRTSRRWLATCVRWLSNASANAVRRIPHPVIAGKPPFPKQSLPLLLKALTVSGRDEDLSRVLHFVEQSPDAFSLDDCQVPGLKSLIPWSRRQFGSVPPQLAAWLASVRRRLESATAQKPEPPTDWARPADVACNCQYCARLKAFLADPANEVGRIPAREDMRQHLIGIIDRHQCDVKHTLERKGSPYSLVLTKTTGSFDRALKRFEADCRLLSAQLPTAS